MDSGENHHSHAWQIADRVGTGASLLCAIHCAALPFVLVLLPVIGLGFLANDRFEIGFVVVASVLAMVVLTRGFRRHQQPLPLTLAVFGIALLVLGVSDVVSHSLLVHSVLVTVGGLSLASAHFCNSRSCRRAAEPRLPAARCVH
ncbi:MAG: MerC domain-containing protein [Xanthomonadales bacterium]|nr:MerC domain-containing protein [Xanthomonadales bacterium]